MRMHALDGWRGIACLAVAIVHLNVAHSLYFVPLFRIGAPVLELFYVAERLTGDQYYQPYFNPFSGETLQLITLGSAWANNLLLAGYLVVVFVAAALLYRFVEEPARRSAAQVAKGITTAPAGAFSPLRLWEAVTARRKRA